MPKGLPPGLAWPVKPMLVASTLGALADEVDVAWMRWNRKPSSAPLSVDWSPTMSEGIGALPGNGATLWIAPIARADAELVRTLVADQLLPEARAWLEQALAAGEAWQSSRHERRWTIVHGKVESHDRDGVATLHS
jgi:hypothetical protein